jgi:hypothetical protein
MNRRLFIRNSSLLSAAAVTPGIIKKAFSANPLSKVRAEHVILCVAGGGIRNCDSVYRQSGNLMPGLFHGEISHLLPEQLKNEFSTLNPVSDFATLIRPFEYNGYAAGHKLALQSILNGTYADESEATEIKWNSLSLFKNIPGKKRFITSDRAFLKGTSDESDPDFRHIRVPAENPTENSLLNRYEDLRIGLTASEILEKEKPRLAVVHFFGADACHSDFSRYAENLGAMSLAIRKIWETAQQNDELKNRTALIVLPDFGRNTVPNSLLDAHGNACFDHSISDRQTRDIFCLIATPGKLLPGSTLSFWFRESVDIPSMVKYLIKT